MVENLPAPPESARENLAQDVSIQGANIIGFILIEASLYILKVTILITLNVTKYQLPEIISRLK